MDLRIPQFLEQTHPGKICSSGNSHLPLLSVGNPKIHYKTNQEYSEELPMGRIERKQKVASSGLEIHMHSKCCWGIGATIPA